MKLRGKLLLIAILPLVSSLALTAYVLRQQQQELAQRQQDLVQRWLTDTTRAELRHYVALALSTVSPYYNTGRDDAEIQRLAMYQLADLDYGPDGYFFLYDFDGKVLMHPRQPELVGRNLLGMHDARGQPAIRMMIDKARAGGGFVEYTWNRPSTQQPSPKLAYVTGLDRWHWMIGTGIYTDDLSAVTQQLDRQLGSTVDTTMRWIALSAAASVAIVFASILLVSVGELRAADAKLTLLTRKLVRTQEEERAWLSRELHDSTSQMLVSAKLLTESALERLPADDPGSRPVLQRAITRLNEALGDIRGISHRLRPAELDTLGLTTALRRLGQEMCEPAHAAFDLQAGDEPPQLPDEIRTTLFRIGQEALTNVCKHAAASHVRMALTTDGDGLQLRIEDDGRGFDSAAMAQHPRRGIGLRNMRERLAAVGGTLTVSSRPQRTVIEALVPAEAIARFAQKTA
ncbi:MAG: cache domain-containing protein [Rubrivivax sp.]|nr:cache domain-containing protein [Rubrivivax sp.]